MTERAPAPVVSAADRWVPRGTGRALVLGALVAVSAAVGLGQVVGRAWRACDVGINGAANSLSVLVEVWIGVGAVNCLLFGGVYLLLPVRGAVLRWFAALAVWLPLMAVVAWWYFATRGTPADYPAPFCPGNVPPWWPSVIPV